jgi:hypothetical protein
MGVFVMTSSITGQKAALVNSLGIVENIIVWQDGDEWPLDHTVVVLDAEHPVSIGWTHNSDNTFTDPNPQPDLPAPPQPSLADLQAQLAAIQAQIASIADKG